MLKSIHAAMATIERVPPAPRVIVSHHLPKMQIGTYIKPLWAHPFVRFFLRMFGQSELVMWLQSPMMVDTDPIVINGTIYCSPRQYEAIKRGAFPLTTHKGQTE